MTTFGLFFVSVGGLFTCIGCMIGMTGTVWPEWYKNKVPMYEWDRLAIAFTSIGLVVLIIGLYLQGILP